MSNGQSPVRKAVALIAGPTASGKSDLAVELALELARRGGRGVVINADSAQVYRDLRVLSARPSEEDMRGVEHRLFGERDGALVYSAADWAAAARRHIFGAIDRGAVPILAGGTGLYIRALLEGIAPIPRIEPTIRAEVRSLSAEDAYAALTREDPHYARRLNPADNVRVARALEVCRSSGCSLAYWQSLRRYRLTDHIELHPLILLPDRDALFRRCDLRFERMLGNGAVEEVEALLVRNLSPELPVMRAIGVREIAGWLRGDLSRDEVLDLGQTATRQYAKRQYTWFRHQPPEHWPRIESKDSAHTASFETLFRYLGLT